MALNLTARATLDTRPYMAGLRSIAAATGDLSKANIVANNREMSSVDKLQKSKIAAASAAVAAQKAAGRAQVESARSAAEATRIGLSSQRYLYADMARMTARAAAGLAVFPIAAAAAGIAWERDFANVVRTADPAFSQSTARVEELRLSLRNMVQTMPTSWGDVTEIATLANQMGIASTETATFTNAVAMFSATSNVAVEQTATAFGRLRSIVPDIGSDFMGLADSILKVGVNSVATESEIINIVTQISSIAGSAGFSSKEMIGLAGALASVRVPPELSRGVVTRVFGQISRAVSDGGASLEGFAHISGMSAKDFSESWGQKGLSGRAFLSFVEGLRKLGPQAEAELRGLGITSVRDVPVMLRLANAADAEGNIGGLLRQTMGDAENAAGETQRQYTIMADTVAAKLKVLANNVMGFFAEIGKTSLGPLGNIIDFVSNGIRDITNSLDDAAKIGPLELGITNSELIGIVATLGIATAGVLALGSAFLKVRQGMAGAQQLMSLIGGAGAGRGSGPGRVASQWMAFPGQVRTAMVAATTEVTRGSSRMVAAANRAGANVTQALYGAGTGRRGKFNPDVSGMVAMETRAQQTAARVDAAFTRAGAAVTNAGRMMGAAASFAFGPWGLAIGVGLAALASWVESTRAASTASSDLAEDISSIALSAAAPNLLKGVEIGGLFGYSTKPLKDGIGTLEEYRAAAIQTAKAENQLNESSTNRFVIAGRQAQVTGTELRATKEYGEALKVVNGAFVDMKNAGNAGAGLRAVLGSAKDFQGLMQDLNSGDLKDVRRGFEAAFDSANVKLTSENLQRLANGDLPAVMSSMLGVETAVDASLESLENFSQGGSEGFSNMVAKAEEVAKSFISIGDAVKEATGEGDLFDMSKFTDVLEQQIKAQQDWASNLQVAARLGGAGFVDALIDMGADAQLPLQALVDDFRNNGGALSAEGQRLFNALSASADAAGADMATRMSLAIDTIGSTFRDADLTNALVSNLDDNQLITFANGMETIGREAAMKLAEGISNGSMSVEEALARMAVESEFKMNADFDVTPARMSLAAIQSVANGTVSVMQLDALPDLAKNAIWDVVTTADGSTAFVQVDGENGQALQDVAYVVDEATGTVATIPLTADDREAIAKANGVGTHAKGVDATVFVKADTSQAIAAMNALTNRNTFSTHTVNVVEVSAGGSRIATSHAGGITRADGGVVTFFANGGVSQGGENHTAHIAPAGTWRTFAEAETEGEAYIPLARRKRTRSIAVLDDVARRFGLSLQSGADSARFANGGQYHAQSMSRAYTAPVRTGFGSSGLSVSDREFFAHLFRTVIVNADGQAIAGLTNNINDTNARFGR